MDTGGLSVRCSALFNEVPTEYPLINYYTLYIIKYSINKPIHQYCSLQNRPDDGYINIPESRKHTYFTHIF